MNQIMSTRLSKIVVSILIVMFCLGNINIYAKGGLVKKAITYIAKSFADVLVGNLIEDLLDKSKPKPSMTARIDNVIITHNYSMWNTIGMALNVSFYIEGRKNCVTFIGAYFSYGNGIKLQDYNGAFRSSDGQIAVGSCVISPNERTNSDCLLFIPYSELHMAPGNHLLKADFLVYTENGMIIGVHLNNYFYFNNSF